MKDKSYSSFPNVVAQRVFASLLPLSCLLNLRTHLGLPSAVVLSHSSRVNLTFGDS